MTREEEKATLKEAKKIAEELNILSKECRNFTKEESEIYNQNLKNTSTLTGINYFNLEKTFESIGVTVKDREGNDRNFLDILNELFSIWDKLDNRAQKNVTRSILRSLEKSKESLKDKSYE